jgi:hypothetical protein
VEINGKTVTGAVGVAVSAVAAAITGEAPWWVALLGVSSGVVAIGLRSALAKLPAALGESLLGVLADVASAKSIAVRVASLTVEERAEVRKALDAADAAKP